MDDRQLAAGIRCKEEEALDELISQYGRLIKSIVTYHLGDFYRDECINDVLFCIWNHIDQYNPRKNSLKNWIGAICKYKCIDYKRKYYKENFNSVEDNDGTIRYSLSKYSADDPLGDVDDVVAFDSIDDLDLSFDLKIPESLPDGFSLTKV